MASRHWWQRDVDEPVWESPIDECNRTMTEVLDMVTKEYGQLREPLHASILTYLKTRAEEIRAFAKRFPAGDEKGAGIAMRKILIRHEEPQTPMESKEQGFLVTKSCAQCGKQPSKFLVCSNCKAVRYCSAECAALHRQVHALECDARRLAECRDCIICHARLNVLRQPAWTNKHTWRADSSVICKVCFVGKSAAAEAFVFRLHVIQDNEYRRLTRSFICMNAACSMPIYTATRCSRCQSYSYCSPDCLLMDSQRHSHTFCWRTQQTFVSPGCVKRCNLRHMQPESKAREGERKAVVV